MKTDVFIKKSDIIVVLTMVLFFFLIYFLKFIDNNEVLAHIIIDNEEFSVIDLSKVENEYELDLPTKPKTKLQIGPSYICVIEAECPDKVCVLTGRLTKNGDIAVCIPARLIIKITSKRDVSDFDAVAY